MEGKILKNPRPPFTLISLSDLLLEYLTINREKIFLVDVDHNEQFNKDQILEMSLKLASYMNKTYNIQKGDCITIICKNRWQFVIMILASIFLKCTFSPLNPNYAEHEFKHALQILKPQLVICESNCLGKIRNYGLKLSHNAILSITKHRKYNSIQEILLKEKNLFQIKEEDVTESYKRICCILFSSGTTGLPKGVMLSNANMIYTLQVRKALSLTSGHTALATLPLFHTFGLNAILNGLLSDGKIIILSRFHPRKYLLLIEKYKIETLTIVPYISNFLTDKKLIAQYDLSSLVMIRCGGAPLSNEKYKLLRETLKHVSVSQGYGLTESTFGISYNPKGSPENSVGKLLPNMECKVVDVESGETLGSNQIGELCLRGPLIFSGYLENKDATDQMFDHEGFMHTGDIGYYDKDGYLFIVDRIKELIKYKGFQIAPAELEEVLLKHPDILDAAVIGKPEENVGEVPMAFVVLRKPTNSNLTNEKIIQFVSGHVSSEKQLRGGVRFVSNIPRNDVGKILRRTLKEQLIEKSKL